MVDEIDRLLKKSPGPPGVQYALIAATTGEYNVYSRGSTEPTGKAMLKAGDVWKYGETTSTDRYDPAYLAKEKVIFVPQGSGSQTTIKVREKVMIYGYFFTHGSLPPGNKIFR